MEVKETKEMLVGVNELSVYLICKFMDGVQFSDFSEMYAKLIADPEFKKIMLDAYEGVEAIPAEMKDIDVGEVIELTSLQLSYIPKIINAIKKPE